MSKNLVTEQEIVNWINNRLQEEYDGDFYINHVQKLQSFDENDCNWSVSVVTVTVFNSTDTTPPQTSITSPINSQYYGGTVAVNVTATSITTRRGRILMARSSGDLSIQW